METPRKFPKIPPLAQIVFGFIVASGFAGYGFHEQPRHFARQIIRNGDFDVDETRRAIESLDIPPNKKGKLLTQVDNCVATRNEKILSGVTPEERQRIEEKCGEKHQAPGICIVKNVDNPDDHYIKIQQAMRAEAEECLIPIILENNLTEISEE